MFKLITKKYIENLDATYYQFIHEKTKAQHYHIACDDVENAMMVSFNTLPYSDNGIMHILEHSCLTGSKKFPVKSLFTSMKKKSLLTFANAATSSNRTYYTIASANKKDFNNLCDIYLDAAFFPNLTKEAFIQEGWRYEFNDQEDPTSELKITGVVYNEMIGKENSVSYKRYKAFINNLNPDTAYAHISGGEPSAITDLTYQEFKDYHKKYYHPTNATFLTYGDANIEELQAKFEENVLQYFDKADYSKVVKQHKQKPFTKPLNITSEYGYKEEDFEDKHHYYKIWNVCEWADLESSLLVSIIDGLISLDASSFMIKALEDSKLVTHTICTSISAGENIAMIIGGTGVKKENFAKLDKLISDTLLQIAQNDFTTEQIEKVLHRFELSFKSKNTRRSSYAASHLYTMSAALPIEGLEPIDILEEEKVLENLKHKLFEKNYLTNFIKNNLINNNNAINLKFMASNKYYDDYQTKLANIAKNKQASLSPQEAAEIIQQSKDLKQYQEQVDDISCLPEFSTKDIPNDIKLQKHEFININGKKISAFAAPTNGLVHFRRAGFLKDVKTSELPYYSIYSSLFNKLGYGQYNYEQRSDNIASNAAYIALSIKTAENFNKDDTFYTRLKISSKMLHSKTKDVKKLTDDIIYNLRFDEKDRIIKTLEKINLSMQTNFHEAGYSIAASIAASKINKSSLINYHCKNLGYKLFIKNLVENINNDEVYNNLIAELKKVHEKVIEAYNQSAVCVVTNKEYLNNAAHNLIDDNVVEKPIMHETIFDLPALNLQALTTEKTTSNSCVMLIKGFKANHKFAGALNVLTKIINTNFMQIQIRENGGAYIANAINSNRTLALLSSRDPNISKSFDIYDTLANWLQDDNNLSDEIIEQGILMSIASIDKPTLKEYECLDVFMDYVKDIDHTLILNYRKNILETNIQIIKQMLDEYILPRLKNPQKAVLANKQQFLDENINWISIEY